MSVSIALSSESTGAGILLRLSISNKGPNAAMAKWKVTLPDGLKLELPYDPLEGTKDLAESVEAEIGLWIIQLSELSTEQKDDLLAKTAKVVGTVTGDGDTYEIQDVKEFRQLLDV